jgi:hypothetical protein
VEFVTGVFAAWLLQQMADASRKRLVAFLVGDEQERALRMAAAAAIQLTAERFCQGDGIQAEQLGMVIDQVFGEPVSGALKSAQVATLLQVLQVGIAAQLAPLDDGELTGMGQSSAQLLGVPGAELAQQLADHLVREIVSRGARGGPLAPLANQLDHDVTHLQGERVEAKLDRLTYTVEDAVSKRDHSLDARSDRPAPWLGRPLQSWGPLELEVHRPIVVEGAPTSIPDYIERAHDRKIRDSLEGESLRLVVIVGGSSTGKTRAAYEAVKNLPPGWRLHYPVSSDKPRSLVNTLRSGRLAPRTVIWLNELQQYLLPGGGDEAAAALREFLLGDHRVLLVGTMWP